MTEMNPKRVLVVGAGICGIVSIAHIKAEGMEPVCYELSDNYGGNWRYHKETRYGQASIMPTTIINHSKEMGALSNFPPRKEFSNYMRHTELLQYIIDYVNHFDVERYIHYNMEVLHVKKASDYHTTGRWTVRTKNLSSGEEIEETFDGVFVATGHINRPYMPMFPGQENFKGKIIHTHSLKEVEEFSGEKVVVVGIGCSGLDAAVEICRVAKQVYISTRSGVHIWNRVGRHGIPIDSILLRRYLTFFLDILPINLISWYLETFYIDAVFDHNLYFSKPKYHIMSKEPVLNDHIASKFLSGLVIQKRNILKFTDTGVVFDGEDQPTEVDTVIMATGYTYGYPFLEKGVITETDGVINLYKCAYPPHLPHPTLAIIAFFIPYGPGFPVAELQIRWAAYLLSGKGKLPSKEVMMDDIIKRHKANVKRYSPGEKTSVRVDFVQFMDEIAQELGVKPNLLKYLFTDFPLFLRLLFGSSVSYQFRLEGHGKWEGAREAIMTVDERMQWPLRKDRSVKKGIFRYIIEYIINLIPLNVHIWH